MGGLWLFGLVWHIRLIAWIYLICLVYVSRLIRPMRCCFHKRYSLLKKSIVELYEEEKHRKSLSYDAHSRQFGSDTNSFALFKTRQFSFSTGCATCRPSHISLKRTFLLLHNKNLDERMTKTFPV